MIVVSLSLQLSVPESTVKGIKPGVRSESRVCRFPIQFFVQILQKNGEYLDI